MTTATAFKFYSLEDIETAAPSARYYIIFGERGNGKTTAVLERIVKNWIDKGEQGAYLRRYNDDIKQRPGAQIFESISKERGLVNEWTNGEWTEIVYYRQCWYLARVDEKSGRTVKQREPFCYAFALNLMERFKGGSYPGITTICFDEFMTRDYYLTDEFKDFQHVVSTIIRKKAGKKVFLLGNTVNKVNPYFKNMGLKKAMDMDPGEIITFKDKDSDGHVGIVAEYCSSKKDNEGRGSASDAYFMFEGNNMGMITDGEWEIANYPKMPVKYENWHVIERFFIQYNDELYQGDMVCFDDMFFIFIKEASNKKKSTDKHGKVVFDIDPDKLLYSLEFSPKPTHSVGIMRGARNKLAAMIADMFRKDLVYYQDNEVGDMVR